MTRLLLNKFIPFFIADGIRYGKYIFVATTRLIDQNDLKRLMIRNGHPGNTTRTLQYLVKGSGNVSITYDSVKGGKVSTNVKLK